MHEAAQGQEPSVTAKDALLRGDAACLAAGPAATASPGLVAKDTWSLQPETESV